MTMISIAKPLMPRLDHPIRTGIPSGLHTVFINTCWGIAQILNSFTERIYVARMTVRVSKNIRTESFMCRKTGYRPANMIVFQDDIYFYLIDHDMNLRESL